MKKTCSILGFCFVLSGLALFSGQERFRKGPPPPDPGQELKLPPIESVLLFNGLNVSVVTRENLPFMSIELVIFAGESRSPDQNPGLATLAANMFPHSTQSRSMSDIEELVEAIGGSLRVSVNQDYALVTFSFLEDYLERALALLGQMILQPNFTKSEVDSVKLTTFYDLLENERNPEFVAKRQLLRLLFKNQPYESFAFSRDVIKHWNQNDLVDFFGRYYRPNNAHLIIVGNLSLNVATRNVIRFLNLWQRQDVPPPTLPPPKPPDKDKICFIDVPQAKDCVVYLGTVFPLPGIQERFALRVLNQILGGTLTSRLFMNLRESKSFAKFAFSETEFFKAGGDFLVRAQVSPEFIVPAVEEIQKEIRGLARESVPPSEIEQAKSYLISNFPLQIARFDGFSEKVAEIKALDGGQECWNKYSEQVALVNSERVFEAAQRFLLQSFMIVIAGDKNTLSPHLAEFDSYDVFDNKGQFQYTWNKEKKGAAHEAR